MKIINLTPHPLVIQRECQQCCGTGLADAGEPALGPCHKCSDGTEQLTIESSGIARCVQTDIEIGHIDGIPVVRSEFGAVEGLPPADPSTDGFNYECPSCHSYEWHQFGCEACGRQPQVYVVSSIAAQAVPERADVYVPARPIRDGQGRIIGCAALGRIPGGA